MARDLQIRDAGRPFRFALPALAFAVVVVFFPQTDHPAIDAKVLVLSLGAALLAGVCVVQQWFEGSRLRVPAMLSGILAAWAGIMVLSAAAASDPLFSFAYLMRFVPYVLIYLVAVQVFRRPRDTHPLMLALCCGVAVSVLYGLIQRAGLDPVTWDVEGSGGRYAEMPGTFGNGNYAGHATVLCIVLAVYLATRGGWMALCWLFLPLFALQIILSGQRSVLVALGAGLVLILAALVSRRLPRGLGVRLGTTYALLALVCACVVGLLTVVAIYRSGNPFPAHPSDAKRYHAYGTAARMIAAKPIIGHGPGMHPKEKPLYWTGFEQWTVAAHRTASFRVHNEPLELAVEAGLLGGALYISFLLAGLHYGLVLFLGRKQIELRHFGLAMAVFFCVYAVEGLFGFNLRVPVSGMMLFAAAGVFEGITAKHAAVALRLGRPVNYAAGALVLAVCLALIPLATTLFSAQWLLNRGQAAAHFGDLERADSLLRAGETLTPWDWRFAYERGNVARRAESPAVLEHFRRAAARNPYRLEARLALAESLVTQSHTRPEASLDQRAAWLEDAEREAGIVLSLCPPLPDAAAAMGRVLLAKALLEKEEGEESPGTDALFQQAHRYLDMALERSAEQRPLLWRWAGTAAMHAGELEDAKRAFAQGLFADAKAGDAWLPLYRASIATGGEAQFRGCAMSVAQRTRARHESLPPGLEEVTASWRKQPRPLKGAPLDLAWPSAASRALLEQALAGVSYREVEGSGDLVWAADVVSEALRRPGKAPPDAGRAYADLGMVYASAGAWARADSAFELAWGRLEAPERKDAALTWAYVLSQRNEYGSAARVLGQALENRPNDFALRYALARTLANAGRPHEAKAEYERILDSQSVSDEDRRLVRNEIKLLEGVAPASSREDADS